MLITSMYCVASQAGKTLTVHGPFYENLVSDTNEVAPEDNVNVTTARNSKR